MTSGTEWGAKMKADVGEIARSLQSGDLAGALAAAQACVKAAPLDAEARWLMAELLLLSGEPDRADRILDAVVGEAPAPAVLEFRRLLRAEVARGQVWGEGRAPHFQGHDATPAQQAALRAAVLLRAGDAAAAAAAAAEAESLRPAAPGTATLADGTELAFEDFRDADDLMAPQIELLSSGGEHMLVPLARLAELRFVPSRRPRDIAWRRAEITLKDGTEGLVFLPALYPTPPGATPAMRLGQVTEWLEAGPEEGALVRGLGQRLFLAGEEAVPAAALLALRFH